MSQKARVQLGGPFSGYVSSVAKQIAPKDAITGDSVNVLRDPLDGSLYRRSGMTIQRDTLSGASEVSGILEGAFSAVCRRMQSFDSPSLSDGYDTTASLWTSEAQSASFPATDTGWFGVVYVANTNQAGAAGNYSLLSEYSATHYPDAGAAASSCDFVVTPYWYESGAGGYARGVTAFQRRFIAAGARNFLQAGESMYLPNLRGTPLQWFERRFNDSTSTGTQKVRIRPMGPMPLLGKVTITTPGATAGGTWADGDTFFISVVPVYKDGSRGVPQLPRSPNATLASGFQMLTVGTIGGANAYTSVTYTIPKGGADVVAREIWRSPKQKRAAAGDVLTISPDPSKMGYIGTLYNNSQTAFVDSQGIEGSEVIDTSGTKYRYDLAVPRRARYIGTGDQRALVGYTLPSPCGIILAPYGSAAASDLNLMDDEAIYGATRFAYRITSSALELNKWVGGVLGTVSITLNSTTSLQDVVDQIHATTAASASGQWVAAVAPGVDGTMASTNLCPTTWDIANTSSSGSAVLTTTADFTNVPLGYECYDPSGKVPAGAYVASKASTSSLTMSASVTASGARTITFFANTGDGVGTEWHATQRGYIRAFSPAYPGHAYLKRTAVTGYDRPDRTSVYFTVGSPGAANTGSSLAPNMWGVANRRTNRAGLGPCMGFVDMESACLIAFAKGMRRFVNVRGVNSGEDYDYRMQVVSEHRGVIDDKAFVGANGWATGPTFEGFIAWDKNGNEKKLSEAVYSYSTNTGDLAYELGQCRKGASGDSDLGCMYAAVMGSELHVAFRYSAGSVPDSRLVYNFSRGVDAGGLDQLFSADIPAESTTQTRVPFGWSARLVQSGGAMCEAVTSSGAQRFMACASNAGTNNGRVDLIDAGDTDNGFNITGRAYLAPITAGEYELVSALRCEARHYNANNSFPAYLAVYRTVGRVSMQSAALPYATDAWQRSIVPLNSDAGTNTDWLEFQYLLNATPGG